MRSTLPRQEQFKDNLQKALQSEKEILMKARKDAEEVIAELKRLRAELDGMRAKMSRRFADISKPGGIPLEGGQPPEPTDALIKRCEEMNVKALPIITTNEEKIRQLEQDVTTANLKTSGALSKRAHETHNLKTQLEDEMIELDSAITAAQTSLKSAKIRFGDNDMGPLKEKVDATAAMLAKMTAARQGLEDELRCKIMAFKVDDQCRRIVPQSVPVHKTAPPRNFSKLMCSMSSPDLGRGAMSAPVSPAGEDGSPGSPAGASKSLKAAAAGALMA